MIEFTPVCIDDERTVNLTYKLLIDRKLCESISHQKMPSMDDHIRFVRRKPYQHWFAISDPVWSMKSLIGAIYATHRNEIGIAILPIFRSHGIATDALTKFMEMSDPLPAVPAVRPGYYVANINPANIASIRLFEKFNATHIQNTYRIG